MYFAPTINKFQTNKQTFSLWNQRKLRMKIAHSVTSKVTLLFTRKVTRIERVETSAIVDSGEINILVENNIEPNLPSFEPTKNFPVSALNGLCGAEFAESIHSIYEEIIQWRKNLFKLPTGKAAKTFIRSGSRSGWSILTGKRNIMQSL